MKSTLLVFPGTFLLLLLSLFGFVKADVLDDEILDKLDDLDVRGASFAFFQTSIMSEPILRAYGQVSSDPNSEDVTTDTVFMIASVSKIFAGAAVLKLVSQGKISLDDDICNVLPTEYDLTSACRNPNYPDTKVTWRMLVTHTSSLTGSIPTVNGTEASYGPTGGYADDTAAGNPTCPLTDVKGFYRDILVDKATETSVGSELDLNWFNLAFDDGGIWEPYKPGTRVQYSNFATGYIAALVEYVSGTSFPEYCKENIFDPLGMASTAWHRQDLPQGVLEAIPVQFVEPEPVGNETVAADPYFKDYGHYCFIDYASGSLRTTAKDMSLFLHSMLDYGAPKLWSADVGQSAFECAEPDTVGTACEYGVIWNLYTKLFHPDFLEPVNNLNWIDSAGHGGFEAGSQTQVVIFPNSGLYALVFINTDGNDDDAAQELMEVWLENGVYVVNQSSNSSPLSMAVQNRGTLSLMILLVTTHVLLMAPAL